MSAPKFLVDHFLIAVPSLADPHFTHGVVLICQHDESGAMGLMINRLSEYRLGDILQQMDIETQLPAVAEQSVLMGGPVQPGSGFVLHDDLRDWNSTMHFGNALAITTSREILVAMAKGEGPAHALVALGYASWEAGQLEGELAENVWLAVPADPSIFFDMPLEARWEAAAKSIGVDISRLCDTVVGHA